MAEPWRLVATIPARSGSRVLLCSKCEPDSTVPIEFWGVFQVGESTQIITAVTIDRAGEAGFIGEKSCGFVAFLRVDQEPTDLEPRVRICGYCRARSIRDTGAA